MNVQIFIAVVLIAAGASQQNLIQNNKYSSSDLLSLRHILPSRGQGPELNSKEDRYPGYSTECLEGFVINRSGFCEPKSRNEDYFLYDPRRNPNRQPYYRPISRPHIIPSSKIAYDFVFVRVPQQEEEPIFIGPPQEKTVVLVLDEERPKKERRVIEVPSPKSLPPEVHFINYKKGEDKILPGGISLKTALEAQEGKLDLNQLNLTPNVNVESFNYEDAMTGKDLVQELPMEADTNVVEQNPFYKNMVSLLEQNFRPDLNEKETLYLTQKTTPDISNLYSVLPDIQYSGGENNPKELIENDASTKQNIREEKRKLFQRETQVLPDGSRNVELVQFRTPTFAGGLKGTIFSGEQQENFFPEIPPKVQKPVAFPELKQGTGLQELIQEKVISNKPQGTGFQELIQEKVISNKQQKNKFQHAEAGSVFSDVQYGTEFSEVNGRNVLPEGQQDAVIPKSTKGTIEQSFQLKDKNLPQISSEQQRFHHLEQSVFPVMPSTGEIIFGKRIIETDPQIEHQSKPKQPKNFAEVNEAFFPAVELNIDNYNLKEINSEMPPHRIEVTDRNRNVAPEIINNPERYLGSDRNIEPEEIILRKEYPVNLSRRERLPYKNIVRGNRRKPISAMKRLQPKKNVRNRYVDSNIIRKKGQRIRNNSNKKIIFNDNHKELISGGRNFSQPEFIPSVPMKVDLDPSPLISKLTIEESNIEKKENISLESKSIETIQEPLPDITRKTQSWKEFRMKIPINDWKPLNHRQFSSIPSVSLTDVPEAKNLRPNK